MARYLFLTWNGAGNQPPAVGIARALTSRGHDVTFAGYESQRAFFRGRGFRFVLLERSSAAWRDEPRERMFAVKVEAAWASSAHLDDVLELLSREDWDVVVVDCLMFGALAAVENTRVPTAVLVHSAPGALMPPGGQFEALLHEPVNRVRREAGRPAIRTMWEAWARFPTFCTSIPELDPLATQVPHSFQYVGPVFEDVAPLGWQSPWEPSDRRPLVLVSFSTGPYWDQSSRIERTLKALAHGRCRVLVTTGMANFAAASAPSNAVIVKRLPHLVVLPNVTITVTHAGHGTVAASLVHGVPLVCLPNAAADQPSLAAQIEALGAGQALDGENAAPVEIAAAVDQVLANASYTTKARLLAGAIADAPGAPAVVSDLERLAAAGRCNALRA
jgi:UDP:flavonoid glycosyltransferase YjiC (YdhE family)